MNNTSGLFGGQANPFSNSNNGFGNSNNGFGNTFGNPFGAQNQFSFTDGFESRYIKFPIRNFTEANEIKLVAIYNFTFANNDDKIAVGIISNTIMEKQKILSGNDENFIEIFKIDPEDTEQAIKDLNVMLSDLDITSVDIYGKVTNNIKRTLSLFEKYNREVGRNQINLDNAVGFLDGLGTFDKYSIDSTYEAIMKKEVNLKKDNVNIIGEFEPFDISYSECVVKSDATIKLRFEAIDNEYYSLEINEGKLVVTGLRSVLQSEKLINFEESGIDTNIEIKATHRIVKNNEEYDLQANVGLLGTYSLNNGISSNQDKLKKSFRMSRYSVEELIKTYALTQFKEFEASDEEPMASGTVLKQSIKLIKFNNAEEDIYFEQLEVLNDVIKDLYNKNIYISIDLRNFDTDEFTGQTILKSHKLSKYIEINSFITDKLLIDIDKEVEKAIEKVKEAAIKAYGQ